MTKRMSWALVVLLAPLAVGAQSAAAAGPSALPSPLSATPNGPVTAVAVSGTTAYVGGSFRHVGPVTGPMASVDTGEGRLTKHWPQFDGGIRAIARDGSGGWYVAGDFTTVGGVPRPKLAHIRGDGTLDPAWAPTLDGFGTAFAMAVFGGRVYVGGAFTSVNGGTPRKNLAAFDATTGAVSSVGSAGGANGFVHAIAVRPGGSTMFDAPARLYVGGAFTQIDGANRGRIASYDSAGALTDTFAGTGFNGPVTALLEVNVNTAVDPNWRLHVGGDFGLFGGAPARDRLAPFDESDAITAWAPAPPARDFGATIYALAAGGTRIYVSGDFGLRAFNRDDGGTTVSWAPNLGPFPRVATLVVSGDTVYAGGKLFEVGAGVRRTNAAAFATTDATVVRAWDPEPTGDFGVAALALDGAAGVLVVGDFAAAGGTPRRGLAAFDLLSGALLPFDPGVDGDVSKLVAAGGRLYVGGRFATVGGQPRRNLAVLDLASGEATAFAPNPNGYVSALAASADVVYLAGDFTQVNGSVPRAGIAALDAGTGLARDFQPAFSLNVNSFALRGADVFMGGGFTMMAGEDRKRLAAVRDVPGTNGAVLAFDPDVDGQAFGLLLDGDRLYAGGFFDNAGTPPAARPRVAAFDVASGVAVPWDASLTGGVRALVKAGDAIVAGGSITVANGQPRGNLAAFATGPGGLLPWGPVIDDPADVLAGSPDAGLVVGGRFAKADGILTGPLLAYATEPQAPASPRATAGSGAATVTVPPPPSGGASITSYTVTASPGGRSATGGGPQLVVDGLTDGQGYTFTATATNRVGVSAASPPSGVVVPGAATPVTPGTGPTPGTTARPDTTAPVIRGLRLTNRRFRLGARATVGVAAAPRGTTFRFTLSEAATTTVTVERELAGRRSGSRCVRPRRGLTRRCTRYVRSQSLTRRRPAGANRIAYSGRVGRRALVPGHYRATLVARDAAGNRSAPARVRFTVVRR